MSPPRRSSGYPLPAPSLHNSTGPLKRHNPLTIRKNVGADYHGCLIITVSQSADLYRKIEGWVRGANDRA